MHEQKAILIPLDGVLDDINKYIEEGWKVTDTSSINRDGFTHCILFILQRKKPQKEYRPVC